MKVSATFRGQPELGVSRGAEDPGGLRIPGAEDPGGH